MNMKNVRSKFSKENIKKFWEENKKELVLSAIGFGAGLGTAILTVILLNKITKRNRTSTNSSVENLPEWAALNKKIDEDIFTDLAPAILESVLEDGVDEELFDVTYTVAFPKGGDPNFGQGFYTGLKNVQILVREADEIVAE